MIFFDQVYHYMCDTILFRRVKVLVFLLLMVIFTACDPNLVYEKNTPIDINGWKIENSAEFVLEITDTLTPHNFYINLRHSTDYKYSNIYLFLDTHFPGNDRTRDTIEIMLADIKGKWYGKGMGKIKENQVMLQKNFVFPMSGTYKFIIEQGMREELLTGMEDIGIRIERSHE
jgi:gliding motility-associated lipoprotein GldH